MAPGLTEFTTWRALAGAAVPVLLAAVIAPDGIPARSLQAASSYSKPAVRSPARALPATATMYHEGDDLRTYVERARPHLDDPQTMYYVAQALEECHAWGTTPDDEETYPAVSVVSHI